MSKELLLSALAPIVQSLAGADLNDPMFVKRALAERFTLDGAELKRVRELFRAGVEAGWLCDRENAGVRFSRLQKAAGPEAWSIDCVHMSGPAAAHTHPAGEVDLCFAVDEGARFDGNAPGFTVYPPNSWHVPTVSGGAMDILYFLPGGAIRFEDKPA